MGEFTQAKLQQYHVGRESAHLLVVRSCMCYISICLKHGQGTAPAGVSSGTGASSERMDRPHPMSQRLLDYVLDDALDHFGCLGSKFESALPDITVLAEDIRQHSELWDHVYIPARWEIGIKPRWPAARHDLPLYILVAFAPNSFMRAFFREKALKPKEGTNPLVYAAHFNKDDHAHTLLLRGARLDHRGWETSGFRQSLPIEVAFQNRHYAMITHFVEAGSTVPPHIFTYSFFKRNNFFNHDGPSCIPMIPSSIARVLVQTDDFAENINNCLNELAWHTMKTSNQLLVFADATEEDFIVIARRFIQVADEHFTPNSIRVAFFCFAVSQGYFSATRYLLTLGTPLPSDLLVRLHHHSGRWKTAPMIRFLVDNGADVLVHTSHRDSVLHAILWAPGGNRYSMVHDADEDDILGAIKLLVGYGCDPLEADSLGDTPLHIAVERGYISVARYLLTLGASLPPDLLVTLECCGRQSTASMLHFLVENGIDVLAHASNGLGGSMLHIALQSLYNDSEALETLKLLVSYGLNPLEANYHGNTPLHIAVEKGHISVARYLLTLGAPLPPDLLVALKDHWSGQSTVPTICFLVENGVDVHAHASDGDSVLHIVLRSLYNDNEALETVKLLVDYGCDPLEANYHGNTPLHIAVEQGHMSVARYLLTLGALLPPDLLVTWTGYLSSTAPMIRFLVENGVDVLARASNGDSVLHIVLRSLSNGNEALEAVKLLVGYGCDPLEANSRGNTPLHIAVIQGHFSAVRYLLTLGAPLPPDLLVTLEGPWSNWSTPPMIHLLAENGVDFLARAGNGDSLLHVALLRHNSDSDVLEVVKLLVGYGCDPLEANSRGNTPLHLAVEHGHLSAARYLLTLGAPLPQAPDVFDTLSYGSLWSGPHMISFLVENGVNVLAQASNGDSVLHITLERFDDDNLALGAAKLLVGYGCNPLEADSHGNTPLQIALKQGHISVAQYLFTLGAPLPPDPLVTLRGYWLGQRKAPMLRFLVKHGVNLLARASNGDSLIHIALKSLYCDDEALKTVKLLVGYGCDPLEANSRGNTPLHIAVKRGHTSVARYFLTLGAHLLPDLLVTLNRDQSHWSTAPMIHFLVEHGVNLLAHASDGDSVLHTALRCFNRDDDVLEAVKLLVGHGCDPLEANSRGNTPFHIAVERGHISAARYLLTLGAPLPPDLLVTLNHDRSRWSTIPMIRFLVEHGVDVLAHASDGDSVLHIALRFFITDNNVLDVVKLLVSYGCDPLEVNSRGETPLHTAASRSYISVSRYLITQGASVLTKVSNGDTVLHFAAGSVSPYLYPTDEDGRALKAIKFLVGCGCEPTTPNDDGQTPLHIAVDLGRIKTIKYLLSLNIPLPCDILFTAIQSDNNSAYCRHIIATLVTVGCDTRTPNSDGDTPLRVAIMKGKADVVEYLLSVVSEHNLPLEDLLSTAELAPPSVQSEMRRVLSAPRARSEGPDLPPAKRARFS